MQIANKVRGLFSRNGAAAVAEPDTRELGIDFSPVWSPPPIPEPPSPDTRPLSQAPQAGDKAIKVDTSTRGASGTANFQGFIREVHEENERFVGRYGIQIYELMRRTDGTVAALEAAIRLPIRAADWQIEPGAQANDPDRALAKEIAEFVEGNLFGGLESPTLSGSWLSQTFESVVENALLAAPMGCAAHEHLWHYDSDKNRIRLRRLPARLPLTFYRFIVEPDGETLHSLVQYGFRGAHFDTYEVPAEKICLFNINQEGANFYGRSVFRPAYKHWYFKDQLYRIQAIGAERNAMGIPKITQGPGASPADVEKSWQWAQNLAVNERSALSLPNGWESEIMGIRGRTMDLTAAIEHHDQQITEAGLAGFLQLGRTATGSRAVGDVKLDFFLLSEEALARMIAERMNESTIRQLVDFNFQPQPGKELPYPKLYCSNIVMLNVMDLASVVKDLANSQVDWLQPTDEQENYMLKKLGMPQKSKQFRDKYAPIGRMIREMEQGNTAVPDAGAPTKRAAQQPAEKQTGEFSESKKPMRVWAPKNGFEQHVDQTALRSKEDATQRQVARLMRRAKPALIEAAARQAAHTPVESLGHLAVPFDHQLAAAIEATLERAFEFGAASVEHELKKQRDAGKAAVRLAEKKKGLPAAGNKGGPIKKRLLNAKLIAQATVTDLNNWINGRAAGAAVDLSKDGLDGDDLETGVSDALLGASDGAIDRAASEAGRQAVAGGRMRAFQSHSDELQRIVRREVMDGNTCEPCQAGDGREWDSWDEVDWHPGDDCEGGDACRGDLIAELATGISSDD